MIEAFRVGAVFRNATLWDGLDLAFDDGEACVVTGPPASGKSTLLRILRGELRPDSGDVLVNGESLYRGKADAGKSFRAISGLVAESFPATGCRTVRDLFLLSSVAVGGLSGKERMEREDELLKLVGLPDSQGFELASLSVSERARVALAAELIRTPRVLFADMLLMNAGKEWADMLGGLFRALAREGRTIILAERAIPDRWSARGGGEGIAKGPFRMFRLPSAADPLR